MGIENIEAVYPVGRLDRSLLVVGGNKQMYELIGEYIYSPLYKIVFEKDVDRLKKAVARCDSRWEAGGPQEDVEECIHLINEAGQYDTYIVVLRREKGFDGYEVELQNVSANIRQMEQLSGQVGILRDYLTVEGNALFSYRPDDGHFKLFWLDYEQQVEICDMSFDRWREQVLEKDQVNGTDRETFESFCQAVKSAEHEQTYTFKGTILTRGEKEETYRVKFLPRAYADRKRILGVWSIINGQTGNQVDDYVQGNYLDSMTKLLNKKGITEYAEAAVEKGAEVAVLMMDIDNFKSINDTYGHLFGDVVITAVADVVKKVIGKNGVAGRVGGDEFMVILENTGDELALRNYLRGIKMNVGTLFPEKLGSNKVTCSIGVARSKTDSDDFRELYQIADKALYLAKEKGKNRYIIYKPELHGAFRLSEGEADLTDIKEAFYSENELFTFNRSLAELVLKGSGELYEVLEHMAHVLTVPRVLVFWGEKREIIGAYPLALGKKKYNEACFEQEEYKKLFLNDMLQIGNVHKLEYTIPDAHRLYSKNHVCSVMQHYLRDGEGNIKGFVTVEECSQVRGFPKVAVQIFESMCKVLNAVLLREEAEKKKALDN
ncbi:MAG: GGDEF domain-containing protein [Firmicutes bacterium]|nr:GGDEF domain-containing protein [Bacillota bacterium]